MTERGTRQGRLRLPAALVGLVLTGVGVWLTTSSSPVWTTRTDVLFLAPRSSVDPNPIESSSESLVATAGLVAHLARGADERSATASSDVSLTARGVDQGVAIELPSSGGQWVTSFDRPVLEVQVVGPSEAWVRARLAGELRRIDEALDTLQSRDDLPARSRIVTALSPPEVQVVPATGDPRRASAAALLLGLGLTGLVVVHLPRSRPRTEIP